MKVYLLILENEPAYEIWSSYEGANASGAAYMAKLGVSHVSTDHIMNHTIAVSRWRGGEHLYIYVIREMPVNHP